MSDYIKHKEYKLPNGRTVTADFNELGEARVTIEAMDYLLMDMINSLVEVVRCKDCKYWNNETDLTYCEKKLWLGTDSTDYCSFGERADK